jgi:hypothetical protein
LPDVTARLADLRRIEQQLLRFAEPRREPLTCPKTCHPPTTNPACDNACSTDARFVRLLLPGAGRSAGPVCGVATTVSFRFRYLRVLSAARPGTGCPVLCTGCPVLCTGCPVLSSVARGRSPSRSGDAVHDCSSVTPTNGPVAHPSRRRALRGHPRCEGLPGEHFTRSGSGLLATRTSNRPLEILREEFPEGSPCWRNSSRQSKGPVRELRGSDPSRHAPSEILPEEKLEGELLQGQPKQESLGGGVPNSPCGRSTPQGVPGGAPVGELLVEQSRRKAPVGASRTLPAKSTVRNNSEGKALLANSERSSPEGRPRVEDSEVSSEAHREEQSRRKGPVGELREERSRRKALGGGFRSLQ